MAQFNFAEKSEIEELHIEPTDVMTGDKNKSRYLLYQLKLSMARAKQIDIIVSFLMESGVRMLLSDLKAALQRGVRIRILTGNYLGITQPSALYLLKKELGDKVELRFYSDKGRSFHPKSYIFHYDNMSEIYIGSSNISRSALTSGIEWNYRFNNNQDSQNFNLFYETFEDLFKNHSYVINDAELKEYSKNWHKPAVAKDLARYDRLIRIQKLKCCSSQEGHRSKHFVHWKIAEQRALCVVWFTLQQVWEKHIWLHLILQSMRESCLLRIEKKS